MSLLLQLLLSSVFPRVESLSFLVVDWLGRGRSVFRVFRDSHLVRPQLPSDLLDLKLEDVLPLLFARKAFGEGRWHAGNL